MKAVEVLNYISGTISKIGKGKKVSLSVLCKDNCYPVPETELCLEKLEYKDNTLYIYSEELCKNDLNLDDLIEIKDGDVYECSYAVTFCRTGLHINLWINKLHELENEDIKDIKEIKAITDVNTHKKLLGWYFDVESIFNDLKLYGYKGSAKDYIEHLLYALSETTIYDSNQSEENYFKMLVSKMNTCV